MNITIMTCWFSICFDVVEKTSKWLFFMDNYFYKGPYWFSINSQVKERYDGICSENTDLDIFNGCANLAGSL